MDIADFGCLFETAICNLDCIRLAGTYVDEIGSVGLEMTRRGRVEEARLICSPGGFERGSGGNSGVSEFIAIAVAAVFPLRCFLSTSMALLAFMCATSLSSTVLRYMAKLFAIVTLDLRTIALFRSIALVALQIRFRFPILELRRHRCSILLTFVFRLVSPYGFRQAM